MTVEQTPLPVRPGQRSRDENLNLTIAKIREVTGAPDHVIKEAIQACVRTDGTIKVDDVITTIIGDDTVSLTSSAKKAQQTNTKALDTTDARPGSSNVPSPYSGGPKQSPSAVSGVQASSAEEYIDLTRDTQGILGGQITREEQDISRVLEASLAESKGSTKRKRGELWFIDPLNPHERRRQEGWPVGLKNVGNTCWFSAVIQSLFHIHKFRDIVLNYQSKALQDTEMSRNLRFVSELRQLFGLMVGSERKYVDPSKSVDILKEASSTAVLDGQQDVSEFQHKLLDWLEDAFSAPSSVSGQANVENPVHQLFQGKYKAEGFHEGKVFSQEVTFGQYPLNVVGFRDIHESLEATTAQGEIETISGDSSQKSGQEIWFTHLPVVLTFELSRFGFNQHLNRAEKIHQQLTFPPVIYLDRYLECNKCITRQKREEARKLKDELSSLQARLDKFMNYGSSNKRYPLPDVLQYALEFAESSPSSQPPCTPSTVQLSVDVEMESPVPCSRAGKDVSITHIAEFESVPHSEDMLPAQSPSSAATTATTTAAVALPINSSAATDSVNFCVSSLPTTAADTINQNVSQHSPSVSSSVPEAKKFKDSSVQVEFTTALMPSVVTVASNSAQSHFLSPPAYLTTLPQPCCSSSEDLTKVTKPLEPHPRSVTTEELRVLQDCLQRWREEVEADVRELQINIASLVEKLDRMYSEDYMKKFPYDLHAVLVHEGQAVSGHYWAFIYDDRRGKWLKFNDITVSESSLEEMHKESVGGYHNASAYCLMYVDRSRLGVLQDNANRSAGDTAEPLTSLPPDLQQIVENDNTVFRQEILSWDEEQRRKSAAAASPPIHQASAASTAAASTMTSSSSVSSPQAGGQWRTTTENQWSEGQVQGQLRGRSASDDLDVVCTGEQRPGETSIIRPMNTNLSRLAGSHAQLSLQATLSAVTNITQNHNSGLKPQDIVMKATENEFSRLKGLSRTLHTKLPSEDPRLGHIVLYLMCSYADNHTVTVVLFEQFSLCVLLDSVSVLKDVRHCAHEMYRQFYSRLRSEELKCYEFWHKRYHHFRQAVHLFTDGVEAYCLERYQEALPYFNQAWLHNREPDVIPSNVADSGINPHLLAYFRRKSLQKLNELTLKSFECDPDITDALTAMTNQILPSLSQLSASELKEDVVAVEDIRGRWCQFLEKDLNEEKIERLQDFLSKMFEGSGGTLDEKPKPVRMSNCTTTLHDKYIGVMRKLKERGELNVWAENS